MDLKHKVMNSQLILICLLLLITFEKAATAREIKKKDGAITPSAEEQIIPEAAELQPNVASNNPKLIPIDKVAPKAKIVANAPQTDHAAVSAVNADEEQKQKALEPEKQQQEQKKPAVEGTIAPKESWNNIAEESKFNVKEINYDYEGNSEEIPQSFVTGFYIFIGLGVAAMLFILLKVYRRRLSRAERKYGVQGDRSTQELVPLPGAIEDGHSDDEDQTLFEVNRQQIRIL